MTAITDFRCTFDNSAGICPEVTGSAGVSFPEAYLYCTPMVQLSLALKEHEGAAFCKLPFCHTLEAEALGGAVQYGDARFCPRAGKPTCTTMADLLACPDMDFTGGRMAQTLTACRQLRSRSEHVALMVSGPFSILNVLMEATVLFRLLRRDPDSMARVFDHIGRQLLCFIRHAIDAGVDIISYADSTGGLNIIGPKNMAWVMDTFTVPFLQQMQQLVWGKAIVLLCPKQAFGLLGTGHAQWRDLPAGQDVPYVQACLQAGDRGVFFGENCINNVAYHVSGTIRALELTA